MNVRQFASSGSNTAWSTLTLLLLAAGGTFADERRGEFEFIPNAKEREIPAQFRLERQKFAFEMTPQKTAAQGYTISLLTFPSPVKTPHANNNTVHCEYFQPTGEGKHPGVIVLHILGGDFELSRLFCRTLAQRGTAALFLKMPYYGPRRQPETPTRMVSMNPAETISGMTQAIKDIRCGASWLAAQKEIDSERLGVMGISLGGITSALAATAEPRFSRVCLLLAGGDISRVAWESKELEKLRKSWVASGGTRETLAEMMKVVDPVTYAKKTPGRQVLMLNASHDEVIPKACTESLWHAFGEPQIYWWDAGHYTAIRYIFDGIARTGQFFDPVAWKP